MLTRPKWRAIVAFTDSDTVSEDWNWFFGDILTACKGKTIFVIHAGPQNKQIVIGPKDNPMAFVDISGYFEHHKGYIFMEDGREVKYQPYDESSSVLTAASDYFKINLINDARA
jgi:hypothetical protein